MAQASLKQFHQHPILNPKAVLFGICVLNFLLSLMYVRKVELEAKAAIAAGFWGHTEHWDPVAVMWEPFLLLLAAVGLLANRWWSLLLSLVAATRVVYLLGYLPLRAIHNAHDVPMFSWRAIEMLWTVYQYQPRYLFEVIVGGVIAIYSGLLLIRLEVEIVGCRLTCELAEKSRTSREGRFTPAVG